MPITLAVAAKDVIRREKADDVSFATTFVRETIANATGGAGWAAAIDRRRVRMIATREVMLAEMNMRTAKVVGADTRGFVISAIMDEMKDTTRANTFAMSSV